MASARQSLPPPSIVGFVLRREMQVEVAVHSVLRNHGVAESTLIRAAAAAAAAAALRRRQLCPHVTCITQLRAPERLQSRGEPKKTMYYSCPKQSLHSLCSSTWPSSICCFKEMSSVKPSVCTKYSATLKAMPKCLIIFLFMCSSKPSKQPFLL